MNLNSTWHMVTIKCQAVMCPMRVVMIEIVKVVVLTYIRHFHSNRGAE